MVGTLRPETSAGTPSALLIAEHEPWHGSHVFKLILSFTWPNHTPRSPRSANDTNLISPLLPFTCDGITFLCDIVHMTWPSLICAARPSFRYISRPTTLLFPPIPSKLVTIRKMSNGNKAKSEEEWQAVLSPEQVCSPLPHSRGDSALTHLSVQFRVLRLKGTEAAGTGEHEHNKATGVYSCAACNTPLYKSTTKFNSGCGWPAFFDGKVFTGISRRDWLIAHAMPAIPGAVSRHVDVSLGMERTEITCTACGGHLGHVFKGEGYRTPSGSPPPPPPHLLLPFLFFAR